MVECRPLEMPQIEVQVKGDKFANLYFAPVGYHAVDCQCSDQLLE